MEVMNNMDVSYLRNITTTVSSLKQDFINPNNTISKIQIGDKVYDLAGADNYVGNSVGNLENEINKIWEKLNKTVSMVHNCANCGATLEIKENKPVFHCKYCGSTYLVGTAQIYSNY